jgi:hypothetical protein
LFNTKVFKKYFRFICYFIFDTLNLCFSVLDFERQILENKEKKMFDDHYKYTMKRDIYNLFFKKNESFWLEIFLVKLFSFNFKSIFDDFNIFRTNFRLLATKHGFYFNFSVFKNKSLFAFFNKNFFLSGFKFL